MKRTVHRVLVVAAVFAANTAVAAHYHVDFYNYTPFTMYWHTVTSGKDHNDKINPATEQMVTIKDVNTEKITTEPKIVPGHDYFKTKNGGDLFKKFEITYRKDDGSKEAIKYNVPSDLTGKHWYITIEGKPGEKWKVTGNWKAPKGQKDAAIAGVVVGTSIVSGGLLTEYEVVGELGTGVLLSGAGISPLGIVMGEVSPTFDIQKGLHKDKTKTSKGTLSQLVK